MAEKPVCLVCHKEMVRGFMSDGGINLPRWCAGEPKAGILGGDAKLAKARDGIVVVAYRCPECEALRLYAPSHT